MQVDIQINQHKLPRGEDFSDGQTDLQEQPWEKHVAASKPTDNLFFLIIL